jgi:signal transduction histidine kinase
MRGSAVESPGFTRERATQVLISSIRRLAGARSISAIAEIVRRAARQLVGADGATFVLRDRDRCFYVDEDAISPLWKGQRFPLDTCISGWAMLHQEQVVIADIYADARIPHDAYRPTFVKSLVITPVRSDSASAAIGTYWAVQREAEPAELAFLQDLADAAAVALENAEIHADLERRVELRTEELVALNRELEAFSYTVAHDLRSPLHVMLGFADLTGHLYGDRLPAQGREMLEQILTAGTRMNALITDLLDFAHSTQSPFARSLVDLSAIAQDVGQRMLRQEPARSVELRIEPGVLVDADERLMRVLLTNLLGNAFKYTRQKPETVIEFGRIADPKLPAFFVRDNGAGFDPSKAAALFKPFQRLHSADEFEGTGVGLATVARIVRRHGGEVWADARAQEGATFYFSLPEVPSRPSLRAPATG